MKNRVISILLAALLIAAICVPVSADFDPATRDSVVVVYTCLDLDGGEYGFGWGSGFFVGPLDQDPSYLITNYHVIEDFVDYGQGELTTVLVNGVEMTGRAKIRIHYDNKDYEEGYVVGYDSIKDVALLKLGNPTSKRKAIAVRVPDDSMVGSKVYAVGYPGLAQNVFADPTSTWGKSDSTVTSGTISRLFMTAGTGTASIQIDCDIKAGNSGGPLVDDNGAAIGINTYGVTNTDAESVNYAISLSEAITLLKQYSVPYVTSDEAPSSSGGGSSDSTGNEGSDETTPTPAPTPQPDKESSFPIVPVIIIAGVVVIAAIIVAVVMASSSKKKKAAQQAQMQQQQQQQAAQAAAARQAQAAAAARAAQQPARQGYVRSLSSQHRGSRVPVGTQAILLGRSQECAVVYQSGTPGISGRHASLTFDAATGEFILVDLQSTYGTFLANGQKLTPNMTYRLRSGDQFYLGDSANMLQVDVG